MNTIIAGSRFEWKDEALRERWRKVVYDAADDGNSPGTKGMIEIARPRGLTVMVRIFE